MHKAFLCQRPELEILLWKINPHLVCITESWLTSKTNFEVELPNYISVQQDRPVGRGGGVLLLIRKEIAFQITNTFTYFISYVSIDIVSILINTLFGKTQITCVYVPPGGDISTQSWNDIFNFLPQ